jgi:acyl-coenzyme A synthetase/AMP-(fatty) acid ligase
MEIWPPCPAPFNLAAHVLARAKTLADKPALEILHPEGAEIWSYARLRRAVLGCGTGLLALGLPKDARVLMRLGNTPAFPILYLAAIAVGLVPVPTSAALTEAEITPMAAAIAPALIVGQAGVALPDHPAPLLTDGDILAMASLPPCVYDMGDPNRLAYVVFTSGTSGRPLPVAHAHRAIWARGMMAQGWQGLRDSDRVLHAGAFNWTYTLGCGLLDPWVAGATALIPDAATKPADLPALLARHRATIFAAAPGVFRQMLRAQMPPLPALRHALSAGEALPDATRAAWEDATQTLVHQAFGLSECSTFVSGSPVLPAPHGATGYPQAGRRIAVLDDAGQPAATGILTIHRSDPGLMLGYLDAPDQTAARFHGDWFLTGDQVAQAPDGAITYLGRHDDLMNPGGYRVSPIEVEAALARFAGVQEVAVTEVEPTAGTRIIACAYLAASDLDHAAFAAYAAQNLARYKQPRTFLRLDALPRNANNKLNRRALRASLELALRAILEHALHSTESP